MPLLDNQSDVSCAQVNDEVEAETQQSVELLANMGSTRSDIFENLNEHYVEEDYCEVLEDED
ncbi:hypothetical protein MIR68_006327 [Amoeboaphelidium protococcarum]|nr:hypothetical protein MIR68_006327 [Amoeboaphelidium protococcarum]